MNGSFEVVIFRPETPIIEQGMSVSTFFKINLFIMKPVLTQEGTPHYVSESEMIKFISENAPMDWNECCRFVRNHNITSSESGGASWDKTDIVKYPKEYNEQQVKWVGAFFEAHPWLNAMVLVFND